MERLGHKNIKTTMERYITNTELLQDQAVDLFEAATSTAKNCLTAEKNGRQWLDKTHYLVI